MRPTIASVHGEQVRASESESERVFVWWFASHICHWNIIFRFFLLPYLIGTFYYCLINRNMHLANIYSIMLLLLLSSARDCMYHQFTLFHFSFFFFAMRFVAPFAAHEKSRRQNQIRSTQLFQLVVSIGTDLHSHIMFIGFASAFFLLLSLSLFPTLSLSLSVSLYPEFSVPLSFLQLLLLLL